MAGYYIYRPTATVLEGQPGKDAGTAETGEKRLRRAEEKVNTLFFGTLGRF